MIKKLLWWCAGANIEVLNNAPQSDQLRYTSIGSSIFFTSILSTASGTYAVFITSQSFLTSILLGLVWGILVTNLNRLLFISVKPDRKWYSSNFFNVLIRLATSVCLAIIISVPLELQLFKASIDRNIQEEQQHRVTDAGLHFARLIQAHQLVLDSLRKKRENEISGLGLSKYKGFGKLAQYYSEQIKQEESAISLFQDKLDITQRSIVSEKIGLSEQIIALNKLNTLNSTVSSTFLFIRFFLILLESLPIMLVLFNKRGIYEQLIEEQDLASPILTPYEASDEKNDAITKNHFERYCRNIFADLEVQMHRSQKRSSEMLNKGLLIILVGITLYVATAYYLIAIFIDKNGFKPHYIYLLISLSLLFIFVQFLGGWFLQQYKNSLKTVLYLNSVKPDLNKYLLAYMAIMEFSPEKDRKNQLKELLNILNTNNKTFDSQLMTLQDTNFANDVLNSLSNLKDLINKKQP
ncbi:DUF4407 domain-containing protein [Mucilaginibacter psychrotolerans]|uniref:DUF4407 domain-containing protein n=1 Tax=Mucilaginibacter psychrotolerans TaxID=1524096 RepID=A0A4Y8S5R2_9SPHI|nr:DUF4407 domain-containing protein [Mucilaginibacter psychrotolerans]TFF34339.1 DUF4407 domain-containing protein [Mucilaginibacter psychrotolerans]